MAVRARFYVASITRRASSAMRGYAEPVPLGEVELRAVARGEANSVWASATPHGELKMTVRGEALPWFEQHLGEEVSILMEVADSDD